MWSNGFHKVFSDQKPIISGLFNWTKVAGSERPLSEILVKVFGMESTNSNEV